MTVALSLEELVRTGTYRNTRHRHLIDSSPTLPWAQLAALQSEYARTDHPLERREIEIRFQRAARALLEDPDEAEAQAAEVAEFEAIVGGDPAELDWEKAAADFDRWQLAQIVRHHRTERRTWRETAQAVGCSVSKARRLLARSEERRV